MPPNETPEPAPPPQDVPRPPPPEPIPASPPLAASEEPPDLWKWMQQCIYRRFGLWGLISIALLILIIPWLWANWHTVKDLPVVSSLVTWFSQTPLPKADPQRFAVALAHLEYDTDHQYEHLTREVLKDFEGVQLLQFDRMISLEGTKPEEREKKGHTQARQYLADAGADVLIWGLVLRQEGKSAPRLYWTTLQEGKRAKEPYQSENFKLPDLFWSDLAEVLRLVVATQASKFHAQAGHFIADRLPPFIGRVRQLLDKSSGRQGWYEIQFFLGNALLTFGEQIGTKAPLEEAVAAYRVVLAERTRERVPLDWAATQNNLGSALSTLGQREAGTARLEEAVQAYRAALQEQTRERVPLDWAATQNNLGNTLRTLGEQKKEVALLCEALKSHSAAWEVLTQASAHYTSVTVRNVERDIEVLKRDFTSVMYQDCPVRYHEVLERMNLFSPLH